MSQERPRSATLRLESLENRENPTALLSEGFDMRLVPVLPTGWSNWSSDNEQQFITTRLQAAATPNSLASLGNSRTESHIWAPGVFGANLGVSASILSSTGSPLEVIARGSNLNKANSTYLAAVVQPGGRKIDLVQEINGARATLANVRLTSSLPPNGVWLKVTLQPTGSSATVTVQRSDTGLYLNSGGQWQAAPTDSLKATTAVPVTDGAAGLGRLSGNAGMAYLDDFAVLAPPGLNESFDTTVANALPKDWVSWSNDSINRTKVGTPRSLSPTSALSIDGVTATQARAWYNSAWQADATSSVAVYADNLIPSGVLARGSNLNSATPTYYSLTATRGVNIAIKKVVNGVETTLATMKSNSYVSSEWVRLSLKTEGNKLSAVVYRPGTQQWLDANGDWQSSPEPALETSDSAIVGGGYSGAVRGKLASGTVWFDDFQVRPIGANTAPQIALTASQSGTTFSNIVTFNATATASAAIARIEFRLDWTLRDVDLSSPAGWDLDTANLTNGAHQLIVRALDLDGDSATKTLDFVVQNAESSALPPRETGVRKYGHIRLAQLAYSGNPMGATELAIARDSLDLIIPNPTFLNALESAAPTTTKTIYTNVSNLYGALLTDWLEYADKNGKSRESAFYHVAQATAFSGSSPSSIPVQQFWSVLRHDAAGAVLGDSTSEAKGGGTAGINFGAAGQSVSIGWTDRYREVNVVLKTAGANWNGRLEYVAEINADGSPKTWKTLSLTGDSTARFTEHGKLEFDPPSDWKASKIRSGSQWLYQIRIVTTGGTGPVASSIFGNNYLSTGKIPAFDATADKNGDGYLNTDEYANRKAGFDARFEHESRLLYPYYGPMRFVTNPNGLAFRQWVVEYHQRVLAANPNADGFFVDNSNGKIPFSGTAVKEATAPYTQNMADALIALRRALPGKWIIANTVGSRTEGNAIAAASTAVLEEFALRPNDASWAGVEDLADLVKQRLNSDSPSPSVILDSHAGTGAINSERTRSGALAYYYLLGDPNKTMFMAFGGNSPAAAWKDVFIPAATYNVGQPIGAMRTFASGVDPENASLTYKVFARDYGNALVLYKPRSYATGKGTGTNSDATATTHQLGGNYRLLKSDGTLGPVITSIALRNGEGATLVKA